MAMLVYQRVYENLLKYTGPFTPAAALSGWREAETELCPWQLHQHVRGQQLGTTHLKGTSPKHCQSIFFWRSNIIQLDFWACPTSLVILVLQSCIIDASTIKKGVC